MPLYTYHCDDCGETYDRVFKIEGFPKSVKCPQCGNYAKKVIVHGHGGLQCDSAIDIPWFESAVDNLQPDHERRIETRGEYKKYLKDNGMVASG